VKRIEESEAKKADKKLGFLSKTKPYRRMSKGLKILKAKAYDKEHSLEC